MSEPSIQILLAEDNSAMANVMRFNLERIGAEVAMAQHGKEAIELLQTRDFDLLVTDLQMPQMSGDELCRFLRQQPEWADLPIVLCSAKGLETSTRKLVEECGIRKVFFKPFSPQELVSYVEGFAKEAATAGA
jgi:CheY-like chemotaxis protein